MRRYTPDYLVRRSIGRSRLVEVKYRADLRVHWDSLQPAFAAARLWAREHGAVFRLATERYIRGATLDNAKRLLPLRQAPLDVEVAALVLAAIRAEKTPTFGGVLAALPISRQAALATLWRLIAREAIQADLHAPITLEARLSLP